MTKLLLDTHVLLWYFQDNKRLNEEVIELLENPENNLYFSIISLWEIAIKINIGKLRLDCTFQELLTALEKFDIKILTIILLDIENYLGLPLHHRDPFDRILLAQVMNHSLILISYDGAFDDYSIQRVW